MRRLRDGRGSWRPLTFANPASKSFARPIVPVRPVERMITTFSNLPGYRAIVTSPTLANACPAAAAAKITSRTLYHLRRIAQRRRARCRGRFFRLLRHDGFAPAHRERHRPGHHELDQRLEDPVCHHRRPDERSPDHHGRQHLEKYPLAHPEPARRED